MKADFHGQALIQFTKPSIWPGSDYSSDKAITEIGAAQDGLEQAFWRRNK
jgi:hypothetical protein